MTDPAIAPGTPQLPVSNAHTVDFRYAPRSAWTCIGRPDDAYKTLVRNDGALLYEYGERQGNPFGRVLEFRIRTDQEPLEITQFSDDPGNSIVVTVVRYPQAALTLQSFGHQHDGERRTDVVLWRIEAAEGVDEFMAALCITARASGRCFAPYRQYKPEGMLFEIVADTVISLAPLGEVPAPAPDSPDQLSLMPGTLGFVSSPQPLYATWAFDQSAASGLMHDPVLLSAGQSIEGAILVPQNHEQKDGLDFAWAQDALAQERHYWSEFPLQPLALEVPDPDIMAMLKACARNILQAREIKDGLPEFQVGPTIYRGLWVVDGHFLLEAVRYLGHADAAVHGIEALLRRVRPDGSIMQFPHHDKETGISVATLVRQTELSGDWNTLRERWPIVRSAIAYIRMRREEARNLPPSDPAYGLLPPSFADGGLSDMRPEYTTALWTLVGLKEAVRAARILGFTEDAAGFDADFQSLLADFRSHAARDMQALPDSTPYLPMCIPGSGDHHTIAGYTRPVQPWNHINPGTATWAFCQAIYPGEVFTPADPLVRNLLALYDQIDDEEGIPAETGWLPFRALWNYHAGFAAQAFLYAGNAPKAVDYLYAFANHAAPTRVWREEQSLKETGNGQYVGDMPHNWASAEFIRLVRHLLVFERGDTLELLPGLPSEWLVPGRRLYVEKTPTRFGPVTLEVTWDALGNGEARVERETTWLTQPRETRLFLPAGFVPEGTDNRVSGFLLLPQEPATIVRFQKSPV